MAPSRPRRMGIWLLIVGSLAASLAFLGLRLVGASDGAAIPFYAQAWTDDGVRVEVLHPPVGGLASGDVVTTVAGRRLDAWLGLVLDAGLDRPGAAEGATLAYRVRRAGEEHVVPVPLARHDIGRTLLDNWSVIALTIVLQVVAAYVVWRRPQTSAAVALALVACGVTGSTLPWLLGLQVSDIVQGWPFVLHTVTTTGLYMLVWPAGALHLPLALSARPEGPSRRSLIGAYAIPLGAYAVGVIGSRLLSPTGLAWVGSWPIIQLLVMVPTVLIGAVIGVRGYRAAAPDARRQIRWAAAGAATAMLAALVLFMGPQLMTGQPLIPWSAIGLVGLPLPLGVAAAVLRYRLFDIEVVVNRTLVYGGLTMAVVVVYAAAVSVLGVVLGEARAFPASLLATGVAALAVLPARDILQGTINRLMFGDREEPWRAITRLGQRLEWTADPGAVFPLIVRTVGDALRLPYVALEIEQSGSRPPVAAFGRRPASPDSIWSLPMAFGSELVGRLVVASRPGDAGFRPDERRLLEDLARQAAAAVHAIRLREDLLRSRQRLVTAREEERRRLRRDLHDGLGPALAAIGMRAEAATGLLRSDPDTAELTLRELRAEVGEALTDVRRLVEGLRPPALDELGLVGALRHQVDRLEESLPVVSIEASAQLPDLPAAVEVAAYRIAVEALTNVVRHAAARTCRIAMVVNGGLTIEVEDDGRGLSPDDAPGVGLASMRERAAELGGDCRLEPCPGGGTRVVAHLPLPQDD